MRPDIRGVHTGDAPSLQPVRYRLGCGSGVDEATAGKQKRGIDR